MIGMNRLDVTVDASALTNASSYRGIGTYVREVLAGLATDPGLAVKALVTDPSVVPTGVTPVRTRRWAPDRFKAREEAWRLPRDLRRAGGDVVWSPTQQPPRSAPAPVVQTLHDVTPLVLPHPQYAIDPESLERMKAGFQSAQRWIAVSTYSADTCAERLDLPRDRIEVIHHGVHARFAPGPEPRTAPSGAYVLYVGEYGPHKGFAEACAVVAELARRGLPHRLRLVGRIAPWWRDTVEGIRAASPRPDLVDLVGFVDDLAAQYQQADALVMTSRHEGFGLPLVEAMACATPVVSFANSSLPEVVGDGGVVVPDGDAPAMAEAIAPILGDAAAWAGASAAALARAGAFEWRTSASRHAEVLRAAGQA